MIIYADISSLYPTLGEIFEVNPPKDFLGVYPKLCGLLKEFRYKTKYEAIKQKEQGNEQLAKQLKAQDGQYKIFLNTGRYGWLGSQWEKFNYYEGARTITKWGRRVIKKVNEGAREFGGIVLKCDTDGSLIIVPEKYRGSKESETEYIKKIEKYVNGWLWEQTDTDKRIVLEHDGRYKGVVLFDDKSYVLQKYDGTTKIKGNTLTGRSNEKFLLQFVSNSIDHVLNQEPEKIREEYDYWKFRIQEKLMTIDQVKKKQSLNMSLEEYQNKAASEDYSPIAQYEAALQADRPYMSGDVIETWNEEPEPIVKEFKTVPNKTVIPSSASYEVIRLAKNFNGNIYRDHYLDRLEKGAKKFLVVLGLDKFEEMFPDISILKDDKAKFITVWGFDKFNERYPKFGWRKKDYKKLSDKDKEEFKLNVKKDNLKINFEL